MKKNKLTNLIKNFIKKGNKVFAPVLHKDKKIYVKQVNEKNINKIDYSAAVPENNFKEFLVPFSEELFEFNGENFAALYQNKHSERFENNIILFGINVLDLKALALIDHVFEKDPFYQFRRNKIIIIGLSSGVPNDYRKYKIFTHQFEENILEHLIFDIFIQQQVNKDFKIFSGSRKGQEFLEFFNIKKYEHVEFAGLVHEEGQDAMMIQNKKAVLEGFDHKLWDELDKICLACGKCSLVCPTCFCFNLRDKIMKDKIVKIREQTTCFYDNFTRVAGDHRFLDDSKSKLYFWYYHKFVRIPDEFQIPGCVSCMRCIKACPVGIDVIENLRTLIKKQT